MLKNALNLLYSEYERCLSIVKNSDFHIRYAEEKIHHSLPRGKADGKGGGEFSFFYAATVFLHREGVDLKLLSQKGGG